MDTSLRKYKKQRITIDNAKKDLPDVKFFVIDSVINLPTTLDLDFLSTPNAHLTLPDVYKRLFKNNSLEMSETEQFKMMMSNMKWTADDVQKFLIGMQNK